MSKIVSTGKTISLEEYHKKRVREHRRRVRWWMSGIFILLIALVFVSRLETFRISEVAVEGAKVITNDEVKRNVLAALSGKYFWLVPKSNAAIFPREEVAASLMKEFPRLASVELNVERENTLRVLVTEREPYALYCMDVCYFLDEHGFIFDTAPDFSGVVYFVYAREVPMENPSGSQFMPVEEFENLSTFIQDLSKLSFEPVRLDDYDLTMNNGSRMLLPEKSDLVTLFSNLESFLESETIRSQRNFLDKVVLLDLRTENKIFYRFRE